MYSTTLYLYQQRTQVLCIDTGSGFTFTYRYNPVYAKILTINKGIDNVLLFEFVNQNEKPVNITGSTLVFRVLNTEGTQVVLQQPMTILNAATGRAKVTLLANQLLTVLAQPAYYTITRASGNLIESVFVDAQSGSRAPINVVDSVLPQHVPSNMLTVPTVKITAQGSADGTSFDSGGNYAFQGNPNGTNYYNSFALTAYFSSFIVPTHSVTTVQMTLIGYTGTVKAQAAADYESVPYNVTESESYYDHTGPVYLNIVGWHPLLRVCFNNSVFAVPGGGGMPAQAYAVCVDGVVDHVIVQNPGNGYLAAPHITFVGEGAGATATATIDGNGRVTAITVTNGGAGYWLVPNPGINTPNYPVPPANQGAAVVISTGYVTDLLYR